LTEFTCLLGGPAFSEFQRQKLVDSLRRRIGQEISFTAKFIYFVESPQAPSQQELSRLEGLLQAESITDINHAAILLVVPRLGTQSPWSTKATDIAHRCGLDSINRIERGTVFYLPSDAAEEQILESIKPLVHDRIIKLLKRLIVSWAWHCHHPRLNT